MTDHPVHEGHDPEDLEQLRVKLDELGWDGPFEGTEGLLRAERRGTENFGQAAMKPSALLDAVEKRELQISAGLGSPVRITTGLGHTANTRNIRP